MICYKGKVLTVDSNDTVAGYLVEDKGRIVYVGNELPEQYKNVQTVELGKKVLVPAFVDTHQHMASFSTFHAGLNVMDAESNEEIAQMVKEFVQSSGNKKTLIAFGASPYSVKEGRLISREELDKVCPDKEIMVVKYDGHACIINSKLLDKLKGKVSKLRGYHEDTGEMNQEAFLNVLITLPIHFLLLNCLRICRVPLIFRRLMELAVFILYVVWVLQAILILHLKKYLQNP